jgi:hypothetical protein
MNLSEPAATWPADIDAKTRLEAVLKFAAEQIEKERIHQLEEQSRRQQFLLEFSKIVYSTAGKRE